MRPLARGFIVLGAAALVAVVASKVNQKQPIQPTVNLNQLVEQAYANQPYIPPTAAEQRKALADRKKAAAELERENEPLRIAFAKFTQDSYLRDGHDVEVTAYGPKHKYLKLKWVLANKVLAYQFSHDNSDMWSNMKKQGFTKFEITDGYDFGREWDLTQ